MRPHLLLPLAASLALAAHAVPAAALPRPEWLFAAGGTAAVVGDIDERGLSAALSLLWPVEDRLWFGAALMADDVGSREASLRDPNDNRYLGVAEKRHRAVYGAGWRLDARLAERRGWTPYGSGTWGGFLVRDDVRGRTLGEVYSTGFSLAAGARHAVRSHATFGLQVRYHRLFNDVTGRYVSAGMEWSWR